jgi:ABC-type glycerol-3-phosphate transport system substrate-binding protein
MVVKNFRAISATMLLACLGCNSGPPTDAVQIVTVWAHHGQPDEYAAMQQIVAAFNRAHEQDELRIEITFYPDRQYPDKVSIAAATGSLPDVLDIDGPYVGPWAAEGILQPLGEFVDAELRDDMLGSLIEQGTYQNELYALGAFDSALVVYYNRDIVEKADLDPPERVADAWTWEQFIKALRKVKPHAAVPLSLHMDEKSDEWFTYAFSPLIWSNGGRLIDASSEQSRDRKRAVPPEQSRDRKGAVRDRCVGVLNGDAAVEAITRWQDLFEQELAQATTTNPDPFSPGLAAFDWTGHWMLPRFEQKPGLHFGVMPLPRMGERFVCASGSWCWGISRACDRPEAAWKVIAWFLDPEQGIKPIVEANGAVPGRRSAFQYFPEYEQMPRRLFREQLLEAAHPRPRTRVYLTLTSAFARALRDIALGADVRQRLTDAAEQVQRALDRGAP